MEHAVLVFSGPRTVNPDVMVCAHDVTLGSPFLLKGNTLQEQIPIEERPSEKTFEVIVITVVTNLITVLVKNQTALKICPCSWFSILLPKS